MSTASLTCPRCGKTARCVYLDMPKYEGAISVDETERLMLAVRCSCCGLNIGGEDELREYGIGPDTKLRPNSGF